MPGPPHRDEGDDPLRPRFESCFQAHYAEVLAFALRRLGDRAAAEDAAAEAFAVAWRRRDRIPEPPLPWLYAVARRVIANQRRAERRRLRLGARIADEASVAAPSRDPGEDGADRLQFASAFGRLNEGDREVLRLIAWEGLEPRQAARVFGCSYGAFRVRLHRARRRLEKHLAATGHVPDERRKPPANPVEEAR